MGCNYYVETKKCECCGSNDTLHIGKSSAGWAFSLHVIAEKNLNNFDDWKGFLKGKEILDEYGKIVSYDEMIEIITNRDDDFKRHPIDSFCIRHGEGTYDYIVGDFC